jgi:hypothetical protein
VDVLVMGVMLGLMVTATAVVGFWMAWRRTRPDAPPERIRRHHQPASTSNIEVASHIGSVPTKEGAFLIGTVTNLGDGDVVIDAIGFEVKVVIMQSWVDYVHDEDDIHSGTGTLPPLSFSTILSHVLPHRLGPGSRLECHAPIDQFVSAGRDYVASEHGAVAVNYKVTDNEKVDHAGPAVILRLRDWMEPGSA